MSDSINAIDVTYQTEISIEKKSTEELTAEVNVRYRQAESLAGMSLRMLADAGMRLTEIKKRIPHGQFENWCADNLEFSKSKAEKMMKLAEKMADENSLFSKTETFTDIGISRVWALLAAPEEVAAEVVETHNVEDLTVRELKEEIARLKNEKADAERKAEMIDHNNDDIRKELASLQGKLADTVSEEEFAEMQKAAQTQKEDLTRELNEAKANAASEIEELNQKLNKAKEDLKKQKEKLKESEAAKEEEIQKGIEAGRTEIVKKAKDDAYAESAADLEQSANAIRQLQEEIAKLSNPALMEFKAYVDQLQDIYWKINEIITQQNDEAPEIGAKMQGALQKIVEAWRP